MIPAALESLVQYKLCGNHPPPFWYDLKDFNIFLFDTSFNSNFEESSCEEHSSL